MRRAICLILPLGLVAAGLYWTLHMWLYAGHLYAKVLLAPVSMVVFGCLWLYSDYTDAKPNEEP